MDDLRSFIVSKEKAGGVADIVGNADIVDSTAFDDEWMV